MSARVNFFKEDKSALTYEKMALFSAVFLILFALFYVIQNHRYQTVSQELNTLTLEINSIKKNQGINASGTVTLSPVETVTLLMLNEPDWSKTLKAIADTLSTKKDDSGLFSADISLENIQASLKPPADNKAKADPNAKKPATPANPAAAATPSTTTTTPVILIEGTTFQFSSLTGFADRLRSNEDVFLKIENNFGETVSKDVNAPQKFKVNGILKIP